MKNKKIGLMLLILFSFIQAKSQSSFFRSDTNLIKISGSMFVAQPSSAGSDSVYLQSSGFNYFQNGDTLTFKHRITNSSGSLQRLVIQLVDASGNKTTLHTNVYSGSSSTLQTLPIVINSSGQYKVRFSFYRSGGNSTQKFEISGVTISSPAVVLAIGDKPARKKPKAPEDEEPIQIFNFYGLMVFEGGYKDFLKNYAEAGEIYITADGYKFIKE